MNKPVYSIIEVTTENRGRDRKLSYQSVPSHDITKFSFEEEIEVLKRVKLLLEERSCDKGNVVGIKGNIQKKKSMSRHHSDVTTPTEYN